MRVEFGALKRKKVIVLTIVGVAAAIFVGLLVLHPWRSRSTVIQGAVVRSDEDTRKELPISDVVVTASDGVMSASAHSDNSGYFKIAFPRIVWPGKTMELSFRRADYRPLDLTFLARLPHANRELHVVAMEPIAPPSDAALGGPPSVVSNIRIRYTVNSQTEANIGSAVKTFQVINKGNVPCDQQGPCSPDGYWKAASGSVSLDAGSGNEFRNVRASCIAGPCPFTRIDSGGLERDSQIITVSALDWSDTATFLLEAEVFHTAISSKVRESYPVEFGRALNFTLPSTQEGVSIEAELDGSAMVFPLGPDLYLSWATCHARTTEGEEKTTVYQCELKPGYRF
jgi:hypothetical protein